MRFSKSSVLITLATAVVALLILASCGGGGGNNRGVGGQANGTINTSLSDPATCTPPNGPFSHVFITVVDVKAHTNANAGDNDAGFVDLTPNLHNNPVQIDLLGPASAGCILAQLATGTAIPAGTYQQFRVILLDNNANTTVPNNQCNGGFNCVVLASNSSLHTLLLSSEATTGIKIPSGQIGGGGVTVPANQTADLNIDFNACASIVLQSNGQYRLKPVLHAGEVSLGATITGTVVDSVTLSPIAGGMVIVALEQKDSNNVDRVVMETVADANGIFSFCPVVAGTYDVVAVAINGTVQYAATVTTGVQPGNQLGNVPLIAQSGASAQVTGQVNTAGASGGVSADVGVSALQTVGSTLVTIPAGQTINSAVQLASVNTFTTQPSGICASGSDCANYTLLLPAANPNVGAFVSTGTTYSQAAGAVNYIMDGQAFTVGSSAGAADCTQADVQVSEPNVVSGGNAAAPAINFTGCT
jgi:hypothetical protein